MRNRFPSLSLSLFCNLLLPLLMMLQLHLLMAVAHAAAFAVVVAVAVVVDAMCADDLGGFATSFDVDVDAINPNEAALGVFNVIVKPNVTDE